MSDYKPKHFEIRYYYKGKLVHTHMSTSRVDAYNAVFNTNYGQDRIAIKEIKSENEHKT